MENKELRKRAKRLLMLITDFLMDAITPEEFKRELAQITGEIMEGEK